jgi:hypothetical protein
VPEPKSPTPWIRFPARFEEEEWPHPTSEAERLIELENFLSADFNTYREVRIMSQTYSGRIDLLAAPKIIELADVVLAFEVKRERFDVERALKQSADYVGAKIIGGPHRNKRIAACFLYPAEFGEWPDRDHYHSAMFQLIAQWRVGRGYIRRNGYEIVDDGEMGNRDNPLTRPAFRLELAIGQEVIWDSRGWHDTVANRMLQGKRTVGGSRREVNDIELKNRRY